MNKVFIKNYKGFTEDVITLKDVNFLVGENSTGKTSLLKLINILCSQQFWFGQEFNNSEVELGYFEEIKNKSTSDDFFSIGLDKHEEQKRVVFKFVEERSVPKTHFVKYSNSEYDILIKITKKQIHYRYKEATESEFKKWCTDFDFPKKYKILDVSFSEIPLFVIFTIIEDRIGSGKQKKSQPISLDTILYKKYLWLAPIRAKAKRIYESYVTKFSPEGEHIPAIIRNLLTNTSKNERSKILRILNEFGRDSNLFDEILVRNYSSSSSSPFEILIKYQDNTIKLPNVGYGVSQALPIIIEILSSKETTFSIQQPEVHLHPKAQAALGSFLFNSVAKDNNNFIIETHSDYTINRFRYSLSKKERKDINAQIIFFERTKKGNTIKHLNIDSDGSFSSKVPDAYRDFYIDEELKMLEL